MSRKRLHNMDDFRRHGYSLRVECRACERLVTLDPLIVHQLCRTKGWDRSLYGVEARMRCSVCGSKRVFCGPGVK